MEKKVRTSKMQTRREFCLSTCQAGMMLALGGLATSCKEDSVSANAPSLPTIQAAFSNGIVTINISSGSPLSSVGSAALVQYAGGSLLVAHTAQDAFTALTSICTHQQCTITGFRDQIYVCPCHGSQFRTNGQVAQGPAASPLRTFQTQFANDQLSITL